MPPFGASLEILNDAAVVVLQGEVDLATAPDLTRCLDDALAKARPSVIVDFSQVSFCDSSGLHAIQEASRGMAPQTTLVVRHPRPFLAEMFRMLEIDAFCLVEE
jgi:anti-sigma B factor antagonist